MATKRPLADTKPMIISAGGASASEEETKAPAADLKPLKLLFSDVIDSDFSPKHIVSPPASSREHSGSTPRVMTFSMFGNTELIQTPAITARDSVDNNEDEYYIPSGKIRSISKPVSRRGSVTSASSHSKRRSLDDSTMLSFASLSIAGAGFPEAESGNSASDENSAAVGNNMAYNDEEHGDLGNPSSNEICPYFLKGGCRFRKNCRLSHSIGLTCPYCGLDLPQTWTQQSKHLKRCWESGVEAEELEMSADLHCELCSQCIVVTKMNFALLNACQHALCTFCAEKVWDPRKQHLKCPACNVPSICVMIRDRMFFDADRKSKMFGIYQKKLDARRARAVQAANATSTYGVSARNKNWQKY